MSGHSKWSKIKRAKGAQDAKRGKIFTKLNKEITIAVKEGGNADPESNPRLRLAIQNAKGANMPKDNIERAIKKAAGEGGEAYHETSYEGYAPGGIAIFVETMTDNLNRTVASVRSIFTKGGGSLGTNGSLAFLFERKGVFVLDGSAINGMDPEELEMELIDGGAEEVEFIPSEDEDAPNDIEVTTAFEDFGTMQSKLEELQIEPKTATTPRIPNNTESLDISTAKQVYHLIEKFEDDDDVQNVYHNLELSDELMAALEED
jgi:YebC/PmpR family DNA-binding regulatory protein